MFNENDKKEFINYFIIGIISQSIIIILVLSLVGGFVKENEEKYIKKVRNRPRDFTCEVLRKDNLYVVTEDIFNKDINYYKINNNYVLYEARSFEYEKIKKLNATYCLNKYWSENNEAFYRLSLEQCKIIDGDGNEVEYDTDVVNIIKLMAKNLSEKDEFWYIIVFNDEYYIVKKSNDRFYTYFYLLKYKNNHLYSLGEFGSEDIIALKSIS